MSSEYKDAHIMIYRISFYFLIFQQKKRFFFAISRGVYESLTNLLYKKRSSYRTDLMAS